MAMLIWRNYYRRKEKHIFAVVLSLLLTQTGNKISSMWAVSCISFAFFSEKQHQNHGSVFWFLLLFALTHFHFGYSFMYMGPIFKYLSYTRTVAWTVYDGVPVPLSWLLFWCSFPHMSIRYPILEQDWLECVKATPFSLRCEFATSCSTPVLVLCLFHGLNFCLKEKKTKQNAKYYSKTKCVSIWPLIICDVTILSWTFSFYVESCHYK